MTKQEYTALIRDYDPNNEDQRKQFEIITYRFPYFQSAYAHYLKSLKSQKQYNFQLILRKTAILSPERNALMQWLNTEEKEQNNLTKTSSSPIEKTSNKITEPKEVIAKETIPTKEVQKKKITVSPKKKAKKEPTEDKAKDQIDLQNQPIAKQKKIPEEQPSKEKLAMSFADWIIYSAKNKNKEIPPNLDEKITLIDTFLKNQPKIPPVKQDQPKVDLSSNNEFNKEELMTETLAKVYLQQKKYNKALYAYKILSLKYPEKNSFFADQLKKIKKLQKNS